MIQINQNYVLFSLATMNNAIFCGAYLSRNNNNNMPSIVAVSILEYCNAVVLEF